MDALLASQSRLTTVPLATGHETVKRTALRAVRHRKSVQVGALVSLSGPLMTHYGVDDVIDWCSGKGHLGRSITLAHHSRLTLVERDEVLCLEGRRLAQDNGLECTVLCEDVLGSDLSARLPSRGLMVGLHACGALGEALLTTSVRTSQSCVLYAPCCFHRGYPEAPYRPMSAFGRGLSLTLTRSALRLPTLDEAVASPSKRARRLREQTWRLAVDLLIREATGEEVYTPLGPAPKSWLAGSFEAFAAQITARSNLPLPSSWSPEEALSAGAVRAKDARALGAARSVFRRPLELWLVLDRALYLSEQGYQVAVRQFCDRSVSPRNLVILAHPP